LKPIKIYFNPIGGSAPLSIYFFEGPYGDATEAKSGNGVYWQTGSGELLGVQFDDVSAKSDQQTLVVHKNLEIQIKVTDKKVKIEVIKRNKAA
jgi:hypothetical protein